MLFVDLTDVEGVVKISPAFCRAIVVLSFSILVCVLLPGDVSPDVFVAFRGVSNFRGGGPVVA